MTTQNINLNNVDAVKYNGNDVSEVKLNNQTIWKQPIETPGNFRVAGATRPISLGEYNRVEFRWEDAGPEKKYIFQYSSASNFPSGRTITVELPENTTSYVATKHPKYPDLPLPHSFDIYGRIKAVSSTGESTGWSLTRIHRIPVDFYYKPFYVANKYIEDLQQRITIQWDFESHDGSSSVTRSSQQEVLIERSTDNQHWSRIGVVSAEENYAHLHTNEYLDYNVVRGVTYYYRISTLYNWKDYGDNKQQPGRPTRVAKIKCQDHRPMHVNYLPSNDQSGVTTGRPQTVILPLETKLPHGKIKIDWGDGTFTHIGSQKHSKALLMLNNGGGITKTYSDTANRSIYVYGDVTTIGSNRFFQGASNRIGPIRDSNEWMNACTSFGDLALRSLESMFHDAIRLGSVPSKIPIGCWNFHLTFAGSKVEAGNPPPLSGSEKRTHLDLSGWDMRWAKTLFGMLGGCKTITTLNLSNWDLEVAADFHGMFKDMENLTSLNLSGWRIPSSYRPNIVMSGLPSNGKRYFDYMFYGCKKLTSVNLPRMTSNPRYSSNGYDKYHSMFMHCWELTSIPGVENWDVSGAGTGQCHGMFQYCRKLDNINLSKWCTLGFVPVGNDRHSYPDAKVRFAKQTTGFAIANFGKGEVSPFYQNENNRPKWGDCVPSCAERSDLDENCQKI